MFKTYNLILLLIFYLGFFPTYLFSDSTHIGQSVLFLSFPLILSVFFLFSLISNGKKKVHLHYLSKLLLLSSLIYFSSILSKVSFLDIKLIINHSRYFAYFFVFTITYNIIYYSTLSFYDFERILSIFGFGLAIFAIYQIFFPNSLLVLLETQKPAIDYLGFRVGSSLEWSYIFAFITLPIFIIGFHKIIRKKSDFKSIISVILLILYLLTQSKAAYIVLTLFFVFYFFYSFIRYKNNKRLYLFYSLSFCIASIFLYYNWDMFAHVLGFFDKIDSGEIDASTNTRLEQIKTMLIFWQNNIWFGYPELYLIIENAYAHYLYNYGIIGVYLYIMIFLNVTIYGYRKVKMLKQNVDELKIAISIAMLAFTSSVFIYALGSSPTDANKSSYLFYFIIGIYFALCDREYKSYENNH